MKPLTLLLMMAMVSVVAVAKHATATRMFEGQGRKIEFDYSVGMASNNVVYDDENEDDDIDDNMFEDVTMDDLNHLRWTGVTPDGYEYEGSLAEVEEILTRSKYDTQDEYEGSDNIDNSEDEDGDYFGGDNGMPQREGGSDHAYEERAETAASCNQIFGVDSRVKANVGLYPYNTIGLIESGCTGAFISKRHVLTAGHCVYNRATNKYYKHLDVFRAKDCDPLKEKQHHHWVRAIAASGYINSGKQPYDYGLIIVKESTPYAMYYGYTNILLGKTIYTSGYPTDKTPENCQWRQSCKVRAGSTYKKLLYRCDFVAGQSGSPIWRIKNNKRIVYGIATHCNSYANKGVRINKARFNLIKHWIQFS